ncbi:unnamed protein product [Triticum turgidum subsp. durum]|uniref:Uncharacterized protein n=1 Tax=Triticum turgidum subsp. durum TaxID=4567 RepID=A0A9R0V2P0_TRITD|nr:unnamed protein product [Triticum turgidum subsp. durum]
MERFLVSASTGAMGSVLRKLGTMLSDEYKLLKGVRKDIKFLKDELEAMQAFLIMMAEEEEPDEQAKIRANAVREMSYEIEDNIDKFMVLVEGEPSSKSDGLMKLFNKSMNKIADVKIRHKIAKDIQDIKSQVKEICSRYRRYKIDESSKARNANVDPRIVAIYRDASGLVGIDGPRDELVEWLSDQEGELPHRQRVVSVVGYGGLGKTTLAKQVYDKLGANYDCQAFVSVSRNPDMTKILSSILSEISNGKEDARERHQQIIDQIRKFLQDKRYFIIIDDVWDVKAWRTLECALVRNNCGSVVMTTTRINEVAKSCCSSEGDFLYKIQPLDVSDSKKLFFDRIFGCEEKCPDDLKEASEDILKKCGGLPLAIIAISSLLATGKTKQEWNKVHSSIVFAQGKNDDIDAMNYILSLSYFDLPLHLRSCLLYLSMFPEDHYIERRRLVHRWISEGFIHGEYGDDLVDIGEAYFHELVNRSLVQPMEIEYDGKACFCVVHDTVLDFLIHKCTGENFCTLSTNPSKPESRVRRLALVGNDDEGKVEQLNLSHARSLVAFGSSREYFPSLAKTNALRVLDLQDCSLLANNHIKDVGRLLQLRYLNVCSTYISELPKEIGDLVYLQTLDVSDTLVYEIPESATQLRRLERLFVQTATKFPDGIGNMESLQDLGRIGISMQSLKFLEELGNLSDLRKLSILWDSGKIEKASCKREKLVSSLCKLEKFKLHSLSVMFCLREDDAVSTSHPFFFPALNSIRGIYIRAGEICWISRWLVSLKNLETLTVWKGKTDQHDVEMVGSIPNLLEFNLPATRVGPITINSGLFRKLQLFVFNMMGLRMIEAGAMPDLRWLDLGIDLQKFKFTSGDFDFGIHHLSSLCWFRVSMNCEGGTAADAKVVEGAFKTMAREHPNRPTLEIRRFDEDQMIQADEP